MEAVRDLGVDGHVSTMEGAQRDLSGNVILMLQRALLVEERVIALVFARFWVAVGLPENAKLLSSGRQHTTADVHTTQLGYRLGLGLDHCGTA